MMETLKTKEKLLERLEKKELEYLNKSNLLKNHENDLWLGKEIGEYSNDAKRKAFVSNRTLIEKNKVDELKCEINQLKRRIKLLDQQFQMLLVLNGGE